jgi:hypothetical protein
VADGAVQVVVEEEPLIGGPLHLRREDLHDAVVDLFAPPVVKDLGPQRRLGLLTHVERGLVSQGDGVQFLLYPVAGDLWVEGGTQDGRRLAADDEFALADEDRHPLQDLP